MSIRIDELDTTNNPSLQHVFAAMKDGLTVQLSVQQVLALVRANLAETAPETLDTIDEIAAALQNNADVISTLLVKSANLSDVSDKVAALLNLTTRNASNSNDGLTLLNQNSTGYGSALRFRGDVTGGSYDFAKMDAENSSTGGQLRLWTADETKTLIQRLRINHSGLISLVNGTLFEDPWAFMPIGVPVPLATHLGLSSPPKDRGYRYVQLTAGLTGSGAYNEGALGSESVSGSAPLVQATATVTLTGSPIFGGTVRLINTEGRFIRPGTSSGTVRADQFQNHNHPNIRALNGTPLTPPSGSNDVFANGGSITPSVPTDIVNTGTYRAGNETYPKHIELTHYMRVK